MSSSIGSPVGCSIQHSPSEVTFPGGWVQTFSDRSWQKSSLPRLDLLHLPFAARDVGVYSLCAGPSKTSVRAHDASTNVDMDRVDLWDSHRLSEYVVAWLSNGSESPGDPSIDVVEEFIASRKLGGQFFVLNHEHAEEMFDTKEESAIINLIQRSLQDLILGTVSLKRVPRISDVFCNVERVPQGHDASVANRGDIGLVWDWPESQEPLKSYKSNRPLSASTSPASKLEVASPVLSDVPSLAAPSLYNGMPAAIMHERGIDLEGGDADYDLPDSTQSANVTSTSALPVLSPWIQQRNVGIHGDNITPISPPLDLQEDDLRGESLSPTFFVPSDLDDNGLTADEDSSNAINDQQYDAPGQGGINLSHPASPRNVGNAPESPARTIEDDSSPRFSSLINPPRFVRLNSDADEGLYTAHYRLASIGEADGMEDDPSIQLLPPSPGSDHSSSVSLRSGVTVLDLPVFDVSSDFHQELEPLLELESALADTSALFPDPDMVVDSSSNPSGDTPTAESPRGGIDLLSPLKLNISSAELNLTEEVLSSPILTKWTPNHIPRNSFIPDTFTSALPSLPGAGQNMETRILGRALSEAWNPRTLFPTESVHQRERSAPTASREALSDVDADGREPRLRTVRFRLGGEARDQAGDQRNTQPDNVARPPRLSSRAHDALMPSQLRYRMLLGSRRMMDSPGGLHSWLLCSRAEA